MDYETQLKCRKVQCEGALTIPIKIVVKRDLAIILTRCYKCQTKYKIIFPTLERDHWLSLIGELFNRCEVCGMPLSHDWKMFSAGVSIGSSFQMHRSIGLANPCPHCRRNGPKSVDDWLWTLLKDQSESPPKVPLAPPSTTNLFCRYCGSSLMPGAAFCGNCGSKTN